MVEETKEKSTEEEKVEGNGETRSNSLLSPEGIVMMIIGITLDFASLICVFLILVFGIGLVLAKIVYLFGLIIISVWMLFRSGTLPEKGKLEEKMKKGLVDFFKKNWKNLAGKAVPAIGDAIPIWTWTVYSELTGKKLFDLDKLLGHLP